MFKAILGYEINETLDTAEYERWLFEVHAPDLMSNPYLDRIVFNKVLRPVLKASDGHTAIPQAVGLYRIAELQFADEEAHQKYLQWFRENPIPVERGPGGRTDFKFYVLAESFEYTRRGHTVGPELSDPVRRIDADSSPG